MTESTDDKLDTIIGKVNDVIEWQKRHLLDYHANLQAGETVKLVEEHRSLMMQVDTNKELLTKVVRLLEGEDTFSELDGHNTGHTPGLLADIAAIRKQSQNGGIPAKLHLTNGQRALVVGAMTFLTGIVVLLTEVLKAIR